MHRMHRGVVLVDSDVLAEIRKDRSEVVGQRLVGLRRRFREGDDHPNARLHNNIIRVSVHPHVINIDRS